MWQEQRIKTATFFVNTVGRFLDDLFDLIGGQELHGLVDLALVVLDQLLGRHLLVLHVGQAQHVGGRTQHLVAEDARRRPRVLRGILRLHVLRLQPKQPTNDPCKSGNEAINTETNVLRFKDESVDNYNL